MYKKEGYWDFCSNACFCIPIAEKGSCQGTRELVSDRWWCHLGLLP